MKTNSILKKLCVVIALGSFCFPAQAMDAFKKFMNGAYADLQQVWGKMNEKVSLARHVRENVEKRHGKKGRYLLSLEGIERYRKNHNLKIDACDYYDNTALYYALKLREPDLVIYLLKQGADINKVSLEKLEILKKDFGEYLFEFFLSRGGGHYLGSHFNAGILLVLQDYEVLKRIAELLKDFAFEECSQFKNHMDFYVPPLIEGIYATYTRPGLETVLESPMPWQEYPTDEKDEHEYMHYFLNMPSGLLRCDYLQQIFLLALLVNDQQMIECFMPLMLQDAEVMGIFKENIAKFACNEYRMEFHKKVALEKNRNVMCGMLQNKKLVDAHWRFV